jgi:glucose 1-dehydrogenase
MIPISLSGKVALVTGAAMGMGEATARLFAKAGAKVMVADINEALGNAVAQSIRDDGGEASFVLADMSSVPSIAAMVDAVVATYGRLDAAVNNAAILVESAPIAELDEAHFDKTIAVNLKGVAFCLKYEIAQMLRQGDGGAIVNIASVNAFRPQPKSVAYNTTKHGLLGLTKTAALENGAHGIRINAVAPGTIKTPMLMDALEEIGQTEAQFASKLSLFKRFGTPDEVAQANLWLVSDHASFVTGTTLAVDAGYTGR